MFERKTPRHAECHQQLRGATVHGANVGKIGHSRLVAKVFERRVGKVEMNALEQNVGSGKRAFCAKIDHSGIVANAFYARLIGERYRFCQVLYQAKFAQCFECCFGIFVVHRRVCSDLDDKISDFCAKWRHFWLKMAKNE